MFELIAVIIIGLFILGKVSKNIKIDRVMHLVAADLYNQIGNPDLLLIDVREEDEFSSGHIKSSINVPLSKLKERYKELPNDRKIVLICRSGKRSLSALSFLKDQGYDNLINLSEGLSGWQKMGYPFNNSNIQ